MNQIKSLFAFLFMLVATLFTASDAQAFALGNHAGRFFLGTLDCAGVDDPGTRNPCRENGWLNYDTLSDYCVATNNVKHIGKVDDLKGIPRNQTLLDDLPNLGNPKANWKQNSSVLRKEMNKGNPIRDASAHLPDNHPKVKGSFLGAERNLLRSKGWSFDKSTGLWSPPN